MKTSCLAYATRPFLVVWVWLVRLGSSMVLVSAPIKVESGAEAMWVLIHCNYNIIYGTG